MKLEITTHHGDFREHVTLEVTDGQPNQGTVERLLRACAYHHAMPQDRATAHVARIVAELARQGWSSLGWSYITLNGTPLPY